MVAGDFFLIAGLVLLWVGAVRARGEYPRLVHYKRVIPCMDIDAGRVVKGTRFLEIRDAGDPVELAAFYDAEGADELVFLDITATSDKRDTVVELARRAADEVFVPVHDRRRHPLGGRRAGRARRRRGQGRRSTRRRSRGRS